MTFVKKNFQFIKESLLECEKKFNRAPGSVTLLAVTKGQSIEKILQAISAGQRAFGENYLQESLPKIAALAGNNLEWHFIGPIQRNKTKKIAEHFNWVQGIDNKLIAERLNAQRPLHLPPLNICLEVNISQEKTKSGVSSEDIFLLADHCLTLPRLRLRGLMAIPAPTDSFKEQREAFHQLRLLYEKLLENGYLLDTLSMGMSHDWQAAVAENATMIRLGTSLFGTRN